MGAPVEGAFSSPLAFCKLEDLFVTRSRCNATFHSRQDTSPLGFILKTATEVKYPAKAAGFVSGQLDVRVVYYHRAAESQPVSSSEDGFSHLWYGGSFQSR